VILIVEYFAERNSGAARKVATALYDASVRLGTHPHLGRRGRVAGIRELVVSRLPYVLAYRIKSERVEVVRAVHGRRDRQSAFEERS
jgi:toxin ParE1/3/4